ncbi:hypothetical protein [Pseudomonas retamae]|uniref:Uncharacterized protein n=1 Tax=Pseudomonas retamae TaxID=702110 RepID=A0ABW7D6T4_9PSED
MNELIKNAGLNRKAVILKRMSDAALADPGVAVTITEQTIDGDLRIPVAKLNAPLEFTIPKPLQEHQNDIIDILIRKKDAPGWVEIDSFDLDPDLSKRVWPMAKTIPLGPWLNEESQPPEPTSYEIRYNYWYAGANGGLSLIAEYMIDKTRPYQVKDPASDLKPKAAAFPQDLPPTDPIDEEYIEANPDGIIVKPSSVSLTYDAKDIFEFFWGISPDPAVDEPVFRGTLPSSLEAAIPISVFEESEEGVNTLVYRATDVAGNVGKISNPASREVRRVEDPTVFKPPVIPLANGENGDDRIDMQDCFAGVDVVIEVPVPNSPAHSIIPKWATQPLEEKSVADAVNGQLTWRVDYAKIKSAYGVTDDDKPTDVSYLMYRGATSIGGSNKIIQVNLFTIGPPNPGEPDPVNINLPVPTLKGGGGSDDAIKEVDYDANATYTIKLFDAPPTEESWLVDVLYADKKVGETIKLRDGQEGTELTGTLPWPTIFAEGTGSKPLQWVLYTATDPNFTKSPPKPITVDEFPIQTAAPTILYLTGKDQNLIGCPTLDVIGAGGRRTLQVVVPKSDYTVVQEEITVKFGAYINDVLVENTEVTAKHAITTPYPDEGVTIDIGDYVTNFKPGHGAEGRVSYTITRSGLGDTPPSAEAKAGVILQNSTGQYCEDATAP